MTRFIERGQRYCLDSPTLAPKAAAFLWNQRMMLQITCRGFAVAQFMQPEPAKYAHTPVLAATSFMQPEQPYFAHHPGRFFYVRDDESGALWSAPFEPVRAPLDFFAFEPGLSDLRWLCVKDGIEVALELTLSSDDVAELWTARVINRSDRARRVSLAPYFPVGYSSWMNMGGQWDSALNAIVCSAIAPYQKLDDYFKRRDWKDVTYLAADRTPESYECSWEAFEGDGGRHAPSALRQSSLGNGDALYEMPACALLYPLRLLPGQSETFRFVFGPAKDRAEIAALRSRLLDPDSRAQACDDYARYIRSGSGCIQISAPDESFSHFVNFWLPRQVFYHGLTNRLTTDPQTRNYLQDAMGMAYIRPESTRLALVTALEQQKTDGSMPDGILLHPEAELKYINKIPHADHPVWIVICLQSYLNESGDADFLNTPLRFADDVVQETVYEHLCRGMDWLVAHQDERGLSFIEQGDWCDPMNMVGYKGRGVSGWLSEAVSYALKLWIPYCVERGDAARADRYETLRRQINGAINEHLWDGAWYGRGITDDNVVFGVSSDAEGRIFLNAQSWALLCEAPDPSQSAGMLAAVTDQLETPFGPMMFAPAYTAMREDVGRVTQKFPGAAENGAVYNHAAAFYAAALYAIRAPDLAFDVLRKMIPGPDLDDIARRGQLPLYTPNYYRGGYHQFPRAAGRSSHLFNTGTAAWFYRLAIEGLFGLRGVSEGLLIDPQLPSHWSAASATRRFRGAIFEVAYRRCAEVSEISICVDGHAQDGRVLSGVAPGRRYRVEVSLPLAT